MIIRLSTISPINFRKVDSQKYQILTSILHLLHKNNQNLIFPNQAIKIVSPSVT